MGAGAIAGTVWNALFGWPPTRGIRDYDVVYYDGDDLSADAERAVEAAVAKVVPDAVVDVTNEARVHLWYEHRFGVSIRQYTSSADAIATWPSTATSVGVRTTEQGTLEVCAPCGVDDLLGGVVRPNKALVTREVYESKAARWKQVWPELTFIPWERTR